MRFRNNQHKPLQLERRISTLIVILLMCSAVVSCSKKREESSEYIAACQGAPLKTLEQRTKALEDGYQINDKYDCIDKVSFATVNEQSAKWEAVNSPNAIAKRSTEISDQTASQKFASKRQTSFGTIPYGISPNEVLKFFPKSRPATVNSELANGGQLLVEIENYPFAGKEFRVGFFFVSNRLIQVQLSDIISMEENDATRNAFERVFDELAQIFGQEATRSIESRQSGLFGRAEWNHDNTKVLVDIIPVTQFHSTLVINYKEM